METPSLCPLASHIIYTCRSVENFSPFEKKIYQFSAQQLWFPAFRNTSVAGQIFPTETNETVKIQMRDKHGLHPHPLAGPLNLNQI